jgi:hypothetical protein
VAREGHNGYEITYVLLQSRFHKTKSVEKPRTRWEDFDQKDNYRS